MRVLVTGGAGFIGSHLVEALIGRGDSVSVVDDLSTGKEANLSPQARFHRVDIRDAEALDAVFAKEKPETVSHHAAQTDVRRSMGDPLFDAQVNVLGTLNVLRLCLKHRVKKVVFASSSAIYPELERLPADETHPVGPISFYGLSKWVGERYLKLAGDSQGLVFTIFRYGNVFGPRQDPRGEAGVVAIFCGQLLSGLQPTLFGDGKKTRDYIYVGDVVRANLLALDGGGSGEVLNLGWGKETTDLEVFEAVRNALGVQRSPAYASKRPGELNRIALDSSRAKKLLGWKPQVPFEEGVRLAAEHYRKP